MNNYSSAQYVVQSHICIHKDISICLLWTDVHNNAYTRDSVPYTRDSVPKLKLAIEKPFDGKAQFCEQNTSITACSVMTLPPEA